MKKINICLMAFLILLLGVGFVSATDDGVNGEINNNVLNAVDADEFAVDGADDKLGSVDDEIIGGKTHVEVNSYDLSSLNPHSVDIYNDSDYVAYVYAPNQSQGNVSVIIGEDEEAIEVFNNDIQSLYSEADENDTGYSYFYIRPSDIRLNLVPDVYYVNVIYKYGFTLSESNDGIVHFVEDANHVKVIAPDEIVIGDPMNSFISIYVEGTLGNLSVLIDGKKIIDSEVFDLKNDTGAGELKPAILVDMKNYSVGQHTYEVSYYGGNWEDVSFTGKINVTYLFDVAVNPVYDYGDEINFIVMLPGDASSNEIRVNNKIYRIDLEDGFANLTLSDFNLYETPLNFTYNDVKYGEKSFKLYLNPMVYVPTTVRYGSDEKIVLKFPGDAQGKVNITLDFSDVESVDIVNGMVNYSLNSLQVGSHAVLLQYDDETYQIDEGFIFEVIPNVEFKNNLTIGESSNVNVDIGVTGNITVYCNDQFVSNVTIENGKINFSIPSSYLHLGENVFTLKYNGFDLYEDPFYYYDGEAGKNVPYKYTVNVGPEVLSIPDEFSQNGEGNIILDLPLGFSGNIDVYVNNELFSTTPALGGINNISVFGLKGKENNIGVVLTDEKDNSYELYKDVYLAKVEPQVDIFIPTYYAIPTIIVNCPSDATGEFLITIGNYSIKKTLENGNATFKIYDLADGVYNTTFLYAGDDKYAAFYEHDLVNITNVGFKDPKLTISVPSFYQGKKTVVTVKTVSSFTGTVKVKIGSKTYTISVVKGKGTKTISGINVGTYSAVATFAEDNVFKSATKSVSFKVKNKIQLTLKTVKVKKSAKKLVITASLKIYGKVAKNKKLKFQFVKKIIKAKTNKKGVAKITITKDILKKLKVGKKIKYQVTYGKTVKKTVKVLK
ncbi:Ig-like domain-containing protein [Methanobrevibacter sp.]|uniref:Ig-like domain-containing protein n=1 Tax=Methanobrevibacter sp. TaxID=66852 RepID=UPI00389073CB